MGCNKTLCDELERIHVRAAKIIYRLDRCTLAEDVLNTFKWQPANRNSLFGDTVKKSFPSLSSRFFHPFPKQRACSQGIKWKPSEHISHTCYFDPMLSPLKHLLVKHETKSVQFKKSIMFQHADPQEKDSQEVSSKYQCFCRTMMKREKSPVKKILNAE